MLLLDVMLLWRPARGRLTLRILIKMLSGLALALGLELELELQLGLPRESRTKPREVLAHFGPGLVSVLARVSFLGNFWFAVLFLEVPGDWRLVPAAWPGLCWPQNTSRCPLKNVDKCWQFFRQPLVINLIFSGSLARLQLPFCVFCCVLCVACIVVTSDCCCCCCCWGVAIVTVALLQFWLHGSSLLLFWLLCRCEVKLKTCHFLLYRLTRWRPWAKYRRTNSNTTDGVATGKHEREQEWNLSHFCLLPVWLMAGVGNGKYAMGRCISCK